MSNLVQAVCPTCKNLLRMPADWVRQPVRCKHCGQVLQARAPAAAPPPARPTPAAPVAPAPVPLVSPVATPAAVPAQHLAGGSPFSDLGTLDDGPRRRRRRRHGGGWMGPVVFLCVLGIAGGGVALAWPRLAPLLMPPQEKAPADGRLADPDGGKGSSPATGRRRPPSSRLPSEAGSNGGDELAGDPTKNVNRFPRRALVISVHNYLYANPVHQGPPGPSRPDTHSAANLLDLLSRNNGFKIPRTQMAHLSDAAGRGQARPPMRPVVEKTLTDFLDSSRAQDRVLVFFIGHAALAGNDAYLVPIDGELDNPASLIPLRWVYDRLAACKARQKVLVLDVARFNPTSGLERPDGGPLGAKLAALLQKPPPGVQVWSACSAGQHSYETDDAPEGAFVEALYVAAMRGVQNKIQSPDDPLPVEYFRDRVNEQLARELGPRKLEQVSFLAGEEAAGGAAYDAVEAPPPAPTLAPVPSNQDSARIVKSVLAEIGTPPIKPSYEANDIRFEALPPFDTAVLRKYAADGAKDSPLRKAVRDARVALWAVSTEAEPQGLGPEIRDIKAKLRVNLSVLQDGFRAPPPGQENRVKTAIENNERQVARILGRLKEALEDLEAAKETRGDETKRWQANYDFTLARLQAQIAFLFEYQSALGRMRKEFPERDPKLHGGWRLAATTKLQGDATGKKLAKDAAKTLDKLAKDLKGTPWEVLAKREKLTALGLDWQPTR
jgi:hypothetical protein